MKSLAAAFVFTLAVTTIPGRTAYAEPSAADAATARSLFDEGRKLMKQGKYAEACPKLEEGVRLNPGIGMRYNLATCYEQLGKTASAWNLYLDVAAAAKLAKQPDREKEARKAASKLEAKLSKLTIVVEAPAAGLEVKRDGTVLGEGALGTAFAVDPGTHTIEATAPDHEPWTTKVEIKPEKDAQTVSVPRLKKIERPKPSLPPPPPPPPAPGLGTTKTAALIVGGVGVVGLGLGVFFGARALSLNSDSSEHCDGNVCDREGFDRRTDARRWGNASTIAVIAGSAFVAGAAVLWFTAGSPERPKDKASIQPWVGVQSGGLTLAGAF